MLIIGIIPKNINTYCKYIASLYAQSNVLVRETKYWYVGTVCANE